MVLNRNPDNFFGETEQAAFHVSNIVPGIDFTNDPLLQGRLFSYHDTSIHRLGTVNFHELPINRPVCPFRNNERDGFFRQTINVAKTNYDKNSISDGLPKEATPETGYTAFPETISGQKVRSRPESFNEHFAQATMFYRSLSAPEQEHVVSAFTFELSKLTLPILRDRVVKMLQYVDAQLAQQVADNLNMALSAKPNDGYPKDVRRSPALSQQNTVKNSTMTRKIAILVTDGVDGDAVSAMKRTLISAGAYVKIVAPRLGTVRVSAGKPVVADATMQNSPSVLFDALYIPGGADAGVLQKNGMAVKFVYQTYVYFKPIAVSGNAVEFLAHLGLVPGSGSSVKEIPKGIIMSDTDKLQLDFMEAFLADIAQHRFFDRENVKSVPG